MARNPKKTKASIPLLCSLCPKTPTFSDISHLLTHISSKAHLSHRFKLQIRSQGEPEARQILDTFETWYAENGLEDLLSERMTSKDKRGDVTKKPRVSNTAESKPKSKSKKSLKIEKPIPLELSQAGSYHAPVPQMHTWSTTDSIVTKLDPITIERSNDNMMYTTPKINRRIPGFSPRRSPEEEPSTPHTSSKSETVMDMTEVDPSKLKGVFWPGMSLFDSATEMMKRKRNQKKDKSVLSQMMLTSEAVEPNEMIFTPTGDLQRTRYIYASPTETSPGQSDVEPTPKKPRAKRAPLANLSTNGPRRSKETFRASKGGRKRNSIPDFDADPYVDYAIANPLMGMHQLVASAEDDENFSLALENPTRKRGFSIFRDVEVASPGRTESPLEEAGFDFPDTMHIPPMIFRTNKPSPAKVPKASAQRAFSSKENKQHRGFYQGGPSANGFPPQMFHDLTSNPLAPVSHAHSFSFGDRPVLKGPKASESSFHGDFVPLAAHKEREFQAVNTVNAKFPVTFGGQNDDSLYHH